MKKDLQALTPPSLPTLSDGQTEGKRLANPTQPSHLAMTGSNNLFTQDTRRRELLEDYPELAQVCDQIGFGDAMTIGEWSECPKWALLELARGAFPPPPPPLIWDHASAQLSELITDLIEGHHRPLRNELRRIAILIEHWRMREENALHTGLASQYQEFSDHLIAHLDHEKAVLFPRCLAIDLMSRLPRGSARKLTEVTPELRAMNVGHEESKRLLQQIRKLFEHHTRNHSDPDVTLIRIGLTEMATNLAVHATKESEFLIPAAIFAEDLVRAHNGSCKSHPPAELETGHDA